MAGAVVGVVVLAASLFGLVLIGGPNGAGAGAAGFLALLGAIVSAGFLAYAVLDLPNGIEIGDGQFAVGVRRVRPAGRLWRRVAGPLDAVRSWEVLSPADVRAINVARRAAPGRQYLGDLRLFSRRQFLRLVVEPGAVRASLPSRIQSGYVIVAAASAGAVWDGIILIGTRHPAALTAALEQALPGRQAGGIRPQAS